MAQEGRRHGVGRRAPARGVHRQGRHRAACPQLRDAPGDPGPRGRDRGGGPDAGHHRDARAGRCAGADSGSRARRRGCARAGGGSCPGCVPRTGPPVRSRCRGTRQRRRPERRCPCQRRTLRPLRDPAGPQARGAVGCGPVDRPGNGRRRPHHQAGHLRREEPPSRFGTRRLLPLRRRRLRRRLRRRRQPPQRHLQARQLRLPPRRRPPLHRPLRHPPPSPPGRAPRR